MKWIKLSLDVFNDEKICLIEEMSGADTIITIWFKLLVLAGRQNHDGLIYLNDKIPYTDEMLAAIFRRKVADIRVALEIFDNLGMIEIVDGIIGIPNWKDYLSPDRKDYMKNYMANYRAKSEQIEQKKEQPVIEEKKKSINKYQWFVDEWNSLEVLGIKPIRGMYEGTQRHGYLQARLKTYTEEDIKQAIEKIRQSDFLQGKTGKKPFVIDCDWFLRPNNFPKVLEGKYDNKEATNTNSEWESFLHE